MIKQSHLVIYGSDGSAIIAEVTSRFGVLAPNSLSSTSERGIISGDGPVDHLAHFQVGI
jgi:hypothetical protein